jgi:hypothetical protein
MQESRSAAPMTEGRRAGVQVRGEHSLARFVAQPQLLDLPGTAVFDRLQTEGVEAPSVRQRTVYFSYDYLMMRA